MALKAERPHLELVDGRYKKAWRKKAKQQEREEQACKLTQAEVTTRIREIRSYLEDASNRIAGLHFDILNSDEPHSLDHDEFPYPAQLAERLNPTITGHYDRVYDRLPNEDSKDDLDELKLSLAETAFAVGVLAGAMFHGASKLEVDKLERGLVHATTSRHWQVKS